MTESDIGHTATITGNRLYGLTAHTRPVSLHGWRPVRHKTAFATSNTLENVASGSLNVIGPIVL